MKTLLWAVLFLSARALAGNGDVDTDLHVEVDPSVYPAGPFAGKGVKTGSLPKRQARADAAPDKARREAAFAKVPGLAANIAGMDELDRDLLYVRARTKPLEELKSLYPKVSGKALARLQKAAK